MPSANSPRDPARPQLIRATVALIAVYALILAGIPETFKLTTDLLGIAIDACVLVAICDLPARYRPAAYTCYRIARRLIRTVLRRSPMGHGMPDHPGLVTPVAR